MTDGQRLLRELVGPLQAPVTRAEVAVKLGVTEQAVGKWARGEAVPDESRQGVLEAEYGIPRSSWAKSIEQVAS